MKKSNSETIAAQIADANAQHEVAVVKRDALAGEREAAERSGASALREHVAALAEAQVHVDVHARRVADLTAAHEEAQADESEAARRSAYAKAKAARESVIKTIESRRAEIAAEIGALREAFRDAEDAIEAANRGLPPGAARLPPAEHTLRRSPGLIGPNSPLYWFGEPAPRPVKSNAGVVQTPPGDEPQGFAKRVTFKTLDHLLGKSGHTDTDARDAVNRVDHRFFRPATLA